MSGLILTENHTDMIDLFNITGKTEERYCIRPLPHFNETTAQDFKE